MYGCLCQFLPLYSQLWLLKSSQQIAQLCLIPESLRFRPGGILETNSLPRGIRKLVCSPMPGVPFSQGLHQHQAELAFSHHPPSLSSTFPVHSTEPPALLGPLQQTPSPNPVVYGSEHCSSYCRSHPPGSNPCSQHCQSLSAPLINFQWNTLTSWLISHTDFQVSSPPLLCPPLFVFL